MESIAAFSHVGFTYKCFDEIVCILYPLILILLADYKEQYVMALIWGLKSQCPCPICLIPHDKLREHVTNYPSHTTQDAAEYLPQWEKALKAESLRPVVVSNSICNMTYDVN
ncbi:hypothetical protein J3R82DRAFT_3484 [Butyriboletus roseoflavus]|nr:hypothetical protein J3R82DRAFT_3484 [Butyriboletus roseoflavus]